MKQAKPQPTCHHYCNCELSCPECIRRFWQWAEQHTQGKGKRSKAVATTASFYEAASKWPARA